LIFSKLISKKFQINFKFFFQKQHFKAEIPKNFKMLFFQKLSKFQKNSNFI
jgi:hypothetical protein